MTLECGEDGELDDEYARRGVIDIESADGLGIDLDDGQVCVRIDPRVVGEL